MAIAATMRGKEMNGKKGKKTEKCNERVR